MADKDTVTKEYMQDSATFADAFNFLLYGGRQVIRPEQLRPLDTTAIALPYGSGEQPEPIQKFRDVLKMVTAMEDGKMAYLVLGIENQSQIHYAMPVRNMLYDAIQYMSQVEDTMKAHRESRENPETSGEYLSGFWRSDTLLPVITLTLYFGAEEWTAPRDLHGMMKVDEEILPFVDNYRLHLIAPSEISDEDFGKFHTELRLALKYVKYSRNKTRLNEIVHEDSGYRSISKKTADMVNIVTGSKLKYGEREEKVDMCLAIEEMRNDAIAEGRAKGMVEGKAEGIAEGRAEGMAEGMEKGLAEGMEKGLAEGMEKGIMEGIVNTLSALVRDGILTLAQAAERAHMPVAEFEKKMALQEQS